MANGEQITIMLQQLRELIEGSRNFPISPGKCILDRSEALNLLSNITTQFPSELSEAQRLLAGRTAFIEKAREDAAVIKRDADEYKKRQINEQEITRAATAQSKVLLASAKSQAEGLRQNAASFVGESLGGAESSLRNALELVVASKRQFEGALGKSAAKPAVSDDLSAADDDGGIVIDYGDK